MNEGVEEGNPEPEMGAPWVPINPMSAGCTPEFWKEHDSRGRRG